MVEPATEATAAFADRTEVTVYPDLASVPKDLTPGVIVFAVKPQQMDPVAGAVAGLAGPNSVLLSIAAGKTIGYFQGHVGGDTAIVRSMPNTPAAVGRGITVCCANTHVTSDERALCQALLEAVGEVEWVEDEGLLDAVTAVSGGGPAYVFLLMEAMASAGEKVGLPADLSMKLARTTVSGAGELARLAEEPAAKLRQNVTSPAGTTYEALQILMKEDGIQPLFDAAIEAATRRSKELAG